MVTFSALCTLPEDSTLGRIVEQKIRDVRARAEKAPSRPPPKKSDRSFLEALQNPGLSLIAEIKRRSPSKGALREDLDVHAVAQIYEEHAAAISVVADTPFFGGNLELVSQVRAAVTRPVLLKDFVISEFQIDEGRHHGADGVLLMASVLAPEALEPLIQAARNHGMEALVEVHDPEQMDVVLETSAKIIGVNNRNLNTLEIDLDNFHRLAPRVGKGRVIVTESGLTHKTEIDRVRSQADAVLIGSHLMAAADIRDAIRALGW